MKKNGFTLLELLVALGLFAAIMGLLMNVFFQFKDQSSRFDSIMSLRREARTLENILRRDLQSATFLTNYATKGRDGGETNTSGILGINGQDGDLASDRLHMHVNGPTRFFRGLDPAKDPEIYEVSYFMNESAAGQKQLNRREQFYIDPDMTDGETAITHAISERVISFDIQYYHLSDNEPLDEWGTEEIKREYVNAFGIPAGVAVTLTLRDEKEETLESRFEINLQPDMGAGIKWDRGDDGKK